MKSDEHTPPATVKESIVRLEERSAGFQRLIDERTAATNDKIERLTQAVENMASGKADQKDLDTLRADFEAHRSNTVTRNEFRLVTTIVTVVMGVIISGLTIWDKLKG